MQHVLSIRWQVFLVWPWLAARFGAVHIMLLVWTASRCCPRHIFAISHDGINEMKSPSKWRKPNNCRRAEQNGFLGRLCAMCEWSIDGAAPWGITWHMLEVQSASLFSLINGFGQYFLCPSFKRQLMNWVRLFYAHFSWLIFISQLVITSNLYIYDLSVFDLPWERTVWLYLGG